MWPCTVPVSVSQIAPESMCLLLQEVCCDLRWQTRQYCLYLLAHDGNRLRTVCYLRCYIKRKHIYTAGYRSMHNVFLLCPVQYCWLRNEYSYICPCRQCKQLKEETWKHADSRRRRTKCEKMHVTLACMWCIMFSRMDQELSERNVRTCLTHTASSRYQYVVYQTSKYHSITCDSTKDRRSTYDSTTYDIRGKHSIAYSSRLYQSSDYDMSTLDITKYE